MAQLVARLVRNEKVRGSNPLSSTQLLLSKVHPTLAEAAREGGLSRLLARGQSWADQEFAGISTWFE